MTPLVWANSALALLFFLAWIGNPLRMTLRHPDTAPDYATAHPFPAGNAAPATGRGPTTRPGHSPSSAEPAAAPAADLGVEPVAGDCRGGHQLASVGEGSL